MATADRSPLTASSAAAWATLATLEVLCDWKLIAAFITSLGPIIQPTRHPVIAYVLATPLTMTHWSASSGTTVGMLTNLLSPYTRCS